MGTVFQKPCSSTKSTQTKKKNKTTVDNTPYYDPETDVDYEEFAFPRKSQPELLQPETRNRRFQELESTSLEIKIGLFSSRAFSLNTSPAIFQFIKSFYHLDYEPTYWEQTKKLKIDEINVQFSMLDIAKGPEQSEVDSNYIRQNFDWRIGGCGGTAPDQLGTPVYLIFVDSTSPNEDPKTLFSHCMRDCIQKFPHFSLSLQLIVIVNNINEEEETQKSFDLSCMQSRFSCTIPKESQTITEWWRENTFFGIPSDGSRKGPCDDEADFQRNAYSHDIWKDMVLCRNWFECLKKMIFYHRKEMYSMKYSQAPIRSYTRGDYNYNLWGVIPEILSVNISMKNKDLAEEQILNLKKEIAKRIDRNRKIQIEWLTMYDIIPLRVSTEYYHQTLDFIPSWLMFWKKKVRDKENRKT